jgi:hypothetical protein
MACVELILAAGIGKNFCGVLAGWLIGECRRKCSGESSPDVLE